MINEITCAIIDDEQHVIDLLTNRLARLFRDIKITGAFTSWEDALSALRTTAFDLLFVDISMPEKTGIELLQLVPDLESEIIFVTAHDNYALDAFAFNTSGYLLKPVSDKDLAAAVNKAVVRIKNKPKAAVAHATHTINDRLAIPNNNGIDYVNVADILYLEGLNKYTRIVTSTTEFISSLNLGRFEYLTVKHPFFQVHRSYIVNLNSILRYESTGTVIMANRKEIPVSRSCRTALLDISRKGF
jgi:two-component system LytT family response regulator